MKKTISLLIILPCFLISSCISNINDSMTSDSYNIIGTYGSISESEWHQILKLNKNGTAELTTISWLPGDENETEEKLQCLWIYEPPYLKIKFSDNKVETFKYLEDVESSKYDFFAHYQIKGIISVLEKKAGDKIYQNLWKEPLRTKFVKESYERVKEWDKN